MKPVGKPDAGNPHVRFDERGRETEHRYRARPRLYYWRVGWVDWGDPVGPNGEFSERGRNIRFSGHAFHRRHQGRVIRAAGRLCTVWFVSGDGVAQSCVG
jgi:hypothetical protein